jgi:NhaP-type Na+/H+ or K+/H+ antiporter
MSNYHILLVVLGIAVLAVAWLPSIVDQYPLSYPIIVVVMGLLVYLLPLPLPDPSPFEYPLITMHLSELCVIIALTGTGLRIDRRFTLKAWKIPLRLVILTMVITIVVMAFIAFGIGYPPASALLLAASLAPTDPVLAGDVQVGEPGEGKEDNVRFALTGEAGMNDGLAFPFVHGAIALLPTLMPLEARLLHWLWFDVLYEIGTGILFGWLWGRLLASLIVRFPKKINIRPEVYGFVVLAITLITYGVTELLHGYGFLAVFVAAITVRSVERHHEYHLRMHDFSDQIERLFIVVLLILFGGAIGNGLLNALTWPDAALGLALLFIVRPLVGVVTLVGTRASWAERWIISIFGIRGIGSIFYIAFALNVAVFPEPHRLWSLVGFVILVSIILHGVLATPVMRWLDRKHGRLRPVTSRQSQ